MFRVIAFALTVFAVVPVAAAQEVTSCSRVEPSGERTLCIEVELAAPPEEVWRLWAEPSQLRTWLAPVVAIDLRPGGTMEASYDPAGRLGSDNNILNRIVAVTPGRSFAMQVARAPNGFPHADDVRELVTFIELEPAGNGTRVRVSMFGYREGAAFDELYAFFERGNAWTLRKLRERIADGPVDWTAQQ